MHIRRTSPAPCALSLLAQAGFALALAGCFQTDPESGRGALIPVRIVSTPDTGLVILAGQDTVRAPASVLVRQAVPITLSVPVEQTYDRSDAVPGTDTRFLFLGWRDLVATGPASFTFAHRDSLSARFGKQFKTLIAVRAGARITVIDSAWRWAGAVLKLPAPQVPDGDFRAWRVNGNVPSAEPILDMRVEEPLYAQAEYAMACSVTVQSDWTAGLPLRLDDTGAVTPVRKRVMGGDTLHLAFPALTEVDASPFVEGPDVRVEAFLRTRSRSPGADTSFVVDSSLSLVIPTRRNYRVRVRAVPDSGGALSLTDESKSRQVLRFPDSGAAPKIGSGSTGGEPDYPAAPWGDSAVPQPEWFAENAVLHLAAQARPGFVFSHWSVNGLAQDSLDTLSLQVKWPAEVKAVFIPQHSLHLSTAPDTSLELLLDGQAVRAPFDTILDGDALPALGAVPEQERDLTDLFDGPDTRYVFDHWLFDGSPQNPRQLSPQGPWARTGIFRAWYKVAQVAAFPGERADTLVSWMPRDTVVSFVASPTGFYEVAYWEVNGHRREAGDTLSLKLVQPLRVRPHYTLRSVGTQLASLLAAWRPALGGEGGKQAARLLERRSGPCPEFASGSQLQAFGASLRSRLLAMAGIRLDRRALSHQVQRRFQGPGYSIEVARLEVIPGVYLPLNIYLPDDKDPASCPLIVTPPGFQEGMSTEIVQRRAANFALLGMVVLVPEGLNGNGARAAYEGGGNNYLMYGRELLGLPSSNSVFLQEMIAAITWAVETFPQVDSTRIGAAGYSYGGAMSLELGEFDTRVRSLSLPATLFGGICSGSEPHSDLYVEETYGPGFVWSPPPELPILPPNYELSLLYPRYLQSVAGANDAGAPPADLGPVMATAGNWWALGGHAERISYSTDDGDHNYGQSRREASNAWLTATLADTASTMAERAVPLFGANELEPDLAGSTTLVNRLAAAAESASSARFRGFYPNGDYAARVAAGMEEAFGGYAPVRPSETLAWSAVSEAGLRVKAYKITAGPETFPVFAFENPFAADTGEALYLPLAGTFADSSSLTELIARYRTVYCADYLGIGELKSDVVMTHTLARQLMFDEANLPRFIVDGLRAWLASQPGKLDIHANGWASSFFGAALKYLEPAHGGRLYSSGVPADEVRYMASGNKVPDLLLRGGLFGRLSELEIETATAQRQ